MSVGKITYEEGEEYYGDWIIVEGPIHTDGSFRSGNFIKVATYGTKFDSGDSDPAKVRLDARTLKMMEAIAEFIRQHQADW